MVWINPHTQYGPEFLDGPYGAYFSWLNNRNPSSCEPQFGPESRSMHETARLTRSELMIWALGFAGAGFFLLK